MLSKENIRKHWFINSKGEYECKVYGKIYSKYGIHNHVRYHFRTGNMSKRDRHCKNCKIQICKRNKSGLCIKCLRKTDEYRQNLSQVLKNSSNVGGKRRCAGIGISGWYKGYYCASTWELAWLVYQLEHNKTVYRCEEYFDYTFKGEERKYYPDFIMDGNYYEIKGYRGKTVDAKIKYFPDDKTLIIVEGWDRIKLYMDYCIDKYGQNFHEVLYENFKPKNKKNRITSSQKRHRKKMLEKYGTETPGRIPWPKLDENIWKNRLELIKDYDKTKFGWIEKVIKETGLSRRQIERTCERFDIEFRTRKQ